MNPVSLLTALCLLCNFRSYSQASNSLRPAIPELPSISLEESSLNADSINSLINLISETPPKDFRGLVILENNQIVVEEYFNTYWRNTVHDIRSAGKSVTALLLGIALKEGLLTSLDQTVHSFFPQNKYPEINPDLEKITLQHLMDMSSGLDADTNDSDTPGHAIHWVGKSNWANYLLQIPLSETPGTKYVYADINPLLISAVIEEKSGQSLRDYAIQNLFDPLEIKQVYWYTNEANQTGAAGNLYLTTLDFAKLGMLVVNEGKWRDEQIIDAGYIRGLDKEAFDLSDENPFSDAYGMFWYKTERTFGKNTVDYLFASGNGGNLLVVVPERKLVIALTSSAYGPGIGHGRSYNIMSKIFEALN